MQSIARRMSAVLDEISALSHRLLTEHCELITETHWRSFPRLASSSEGRFGLLDVTIEEGPPQQISISKVSIRDAAGEVLRKQASDAIELLEWLSDTLQARVSFARETLSVRLKIDNGTPCKGSLKEQASAVEEELEKIRQKVESLEDDRAGDVLLAIDTNSLIFNTALESWRFDGIKKFTAVLTPAVLSELDALKNVGRTDNLKEKAATIIRQLKEYRRRGDWHKGVVLTRNAVELLIMPLEPKFKGLSWLDPEVKDDRIIASVIGLISQHPKSCVAIITRDVNLQNKCDFAKICTLEPPPAETTN